MSQNTVAFDDVNALLAPYPELESASFLQGMLMGLMCRQSAFKEAVWLKRLLDEAKVTSVKEGFLVKMHEVYLDAEASLNGSGFELTLCLPADSEDLAFRAQMLGQWCEGFLYGMGLAGKTAEKLQGEVVELCRDFGDIAGIDSSELMEATEQDEADFMELVEFVKIGVLTINETLNPVEASPIMTQTPPTESLH